MQLIKRIAFPSLALALCGGALADSTINSTAKFAYSANAGWINFRPDQPASPTGVVFGDYFLSGFAYAANFGWVNFGDGGPANGIRYQNTSVGDCGVNHDGQGNLGGFAYGANIGWINFGWAAATDPARPRVDLVTGGFEGYAWSGNIGWINLGTGYLTTDRMAIVDKDEDGIADAWELSYFANDLTIATATGDFDGDGFSDAAEYLADTAPNDPADHFRIISADYDETFTKAEVTFTTKPTRFYQLQLAGDLVAWSNSSLGTFAPGPGDTTGKTVGWPGGPRQFIRAVAVRPLP